MARPRKGQTGDGGGGIILMDDRLAMLVAYAKGTLKERLEPEAEGILCAYVERCLDPEMSAAIDRAIEDDDQIAAVIERGRQNKAWCDAQLLPRIRAKQSELQQPSPELQHSVDEFLRSKVPPQCETGKVVPLDRAEPRLPVAARDAEVPEVPDTPPPPPRSHYWLIAASLLAIVSLGPAAYYALQDWQLAQQEQIADVLAIVEEQQRRTAGVQATLDTYKPIARQLKEAQQRVAELERERAAAQLQIETLQQQGAGQTATVEQLQASLTAARRAHDAARQERDKAKQDLEETRAAQVKLAQPGELEAELTEQLADLAIQRRRLDAQLAQQDEQLAQQARQLSWVNQVALYHRAFDALPETRRVEASAAREEEVNAWLAQFGRDLGLTQPIPVPDFSDVGLEFAGVRMFMVNGQTVPQLAYRDQVDRLFALCVMKNKAGEPKAVSQSELDDLHLVEWRDSKFSYVLVGWQPFEVLEGLSERLQQSFKLGA